LEANITIKRCLSNVKAYPIRWRHLKPLLDKTVLRAQLVPLWIATDLHNPWHLADYPQKIFEEEKQYTGKIQKIYNKCLFLS
jgi:hypothetical protein